MPDCNITNLLDTVTRPDVPDLDTSSLAGLAWVLRHEEAWPEGFVWNYSQCNSCAMGMTRELWFKRMWPDNGTYRAMAEIGRRFSVGQHDVELLFMQLHGTKRAADVTPEHVADAIDAYLVGRA